MNNNFRELVRELLEHIDNNPLTDEQIEKIEKNEDVDKIAQIIKLFLGVSDIESK